MRNLKDELNTAREQESAREFARNKEEAGKTINRVLYEANGIRKFLWQVAVVVFWIWKNLLWPLSIWISPAAVNVFNWYKGLWNRITITPDKYGVMRFRKKRGIILALSTVVAVVFAFNLAIFTIDATVWAVHHKTDDWIFLYRSEDSFQANDIYSVSGCEITNPALKARIEENLQEALKEARGSDLSCRDVDGLYFRVQFSWFDWFYRLIRTGQPFFFPDLVHSSIATNWNICRTDNYGFRWKWLMGLHWEQLYPKLLVTECHSIGS